MVWASWIVTGIALLLPLRRVLECVFLSRSMACITDRRGAVASVSAVDAPHLLVLLPLLDEQTMVEPLIDHFTAMACVPGRTRFVLITTEKERADPARGPTTRTRVERALQERRLDDGRWQHLHFPRVHAFRADQLNFAVGLVASLSPAARTYVGVYNADSRPDLDTFQALSDDACAERERTGELPSVYQQGAVYTVPPRHRRHSALLVAAAAFQTVYTIAHLLRRLVAASGAPVRGCGQLARAVPVQLLGHGEFVRMDVLAQVGLFPAFAYADGLLLGWLLALHGHTIRVLPAFDHCEMPPTIGALVRQHKAWFVGLLNLPAAVRIRYAQERPADRRRLVVFCVRRMAATIGWGLRAPAIAVLLLAGALTGWRTFGVTVASVLIYAVVPLLCVSRYQRLSPVPSVTPASAAALLRWPLLASLPTLFVDGIGFWPAIVFRFRTGAGNAVPPKTERERAMPEAAALPDPVNEKR